MQAALIDAVFGKVVLALEKTVEIDAGYLSLDTHLVIDLQLRRFDLIRLALCLEEYFEVELSNLDVDGFKTLGDIALYMLRRSNGVGDWVSYRKITA